MSDHVKFETPPPGEFWPHTWFELPEVVVCLTQVGDIPMELWNRWADAAGAEGVRALLGMAIGPVTVNTVQRRSAAEVLSMRRVAAVTNSSVGRGILTAISWLGTDIRGYRWTELDRAVERLKLETVSTARVLELIEELLVRSGAPTLDQLCSKSK